MRHDLSLSIIAVVTLELCCGCSSSTNSPSSTNPPSADIAVTAVSAAKPPDPILVHGNVNVLGGTGGEIPFTLELPPGWTWSDGQAEKILSTAQTIIVSLT